MLVLALMVTCAVGLQAGVVRTRPKMASEKSLCVVGCGVLGTRAATEWLRRYPSAVVCGETQSESRHEALRSAGIAPRTRSQRDGTKYEAVLVATPPSAYADGEAYAAEVRAAAELCEGTLVLISSGGVYKEDCGGTCVETSELTDSPRSAKLLAAEAAALPSGAVLRLAGLYTLDRGAHVFWYKKGTVDANPESLVNLLHYDDAASAAVNALEGRAQPGDIFLAADMHPRSRQAIVDAARLHPTFSHKPPVNFTGLPANARGPKGQGKVYDCSFTMDRLDWRPQFPTFEAFIHHDIHQLGLASSSSATDDL